MSEIIARPDIDALETLLGPATGLPWLESDGDRGPNFYLELISPYDGDVDGDGRHIVIGGEPICSFLDNERDYHDCALVRAAVNSLPSLIAYVKRLEAVLDLYTEDAVCGLCDAEVSSGQAARAALNPTPERTNDEQG